MTAREDNSPADDGLVAAQAEPNPDQRLGAEVGRLVAQERQQAEHGLPVGAHGAEGPQRGSSLRAEEAIGVVPCALDQRRDQQWCQRGICGGAQLFEEVG